MRIQKVIQRRLQRSVEGLNLASRVNAAIGANVGEDDGSVTAAAVSNDDAIVQTSRGSARSSA